MGKQRSYATRPGKAKFNSTYSISFMSIAHTGLWFGCVSHSSCVTKVISAALHNRKCGGVIGPCSHDNGLMLLPWKWVSYFKRMGLSWPVMFPWVPPPCNILKHANRLLSDTSPSPGFTYSRNMNQRSLVITSYPFRYFLTTAKVAKNKGWCTNEGRLAACSFPGHPDPK